MRSRCQIWNTVRGFAQLGDGDGHSATAPSRSSTGAGQTTCTPSEARPSSPASTWATLSHPDRCIARLPHNRRRNRAWSGSASLLDHRGRPRSAERAGGGGQQHQGQVVIESRTSVGQQQPHQAVQGVARRGRGETGLHPVVQLELAPVGRSRLHQPIRVQQQPILGPQPDLLHHRGRIQAQRRGWPAGLQQHPHRSAGPATAADGHS
jgi:hypothetical protein